MLVAVVVHVMTLRIHLGQVELVEVATVPMVVPLLVGMELPIAAVVAAAAVVWVRQVVIVDRLEMVDRALSLFRMLARSVVLAAP